MRKTFIFIAVVFILSMFTVGISAQRKARLGRVCGDPNVRCPGGTQFQPHELPFEIRGNTSLVDSKPFYAIILNSVKLTPEADCANLVSEQERLETQRLFPRNKVFALKCSEAGDVNYTNVANSVSFTAVYAGSTLAEAQKFLKTVQKAGKFGSVRIRKMQAFINGT